MAEFDATKMDNAAKEADLELEKLKATNPEGVKAVTGRGAGDDNSPYPPPIPFASLRVTGDALLIQSRL